MLWAPESRTDLSRTNRRGEPVVVNGQSLTVPALAAVARYHAPLVLDVSQDMKEKLVASRRVIVDKVGQSKSVYGVSTGFGGSADTRTDNPLALGAALLQHQQSGRDPARRSSVHRLLRQRHLQRQLVHQLATPMLWRLTGFLASAGTVARRGTGPSPALHVVRA